ncbi:MAG: glycerophosphodiester phosphodiesterase family protein [Pseudomonadota bacterium]
MSRLGRDFLERPIAHRGLHGPGAPENSLSAFRAAREAGYGVELDVQLSADGRAMVFHDPTLERLTARTGAVAELTAADLAEIALKGGREDRIPTLTQALEAAGEAPVLVEIKPQPGPEALAALAAETGRVLAAHRGPVAAMSFDPRAAGPFRAEAPGVAFGLLGKDFVGSRRGEAGWPEMTPDERRRLTDLAMFEETGADFVSYHWRDLAHPPVQALRARGVPVLCWTTRGPGEDAKARELANNVTFEGYRPETPRRH